MTLDLAESLLLAEAVSPRALARGLFLDVTQRMSLVQALLATGAIDETKIEDALKKPDDDPLTTITPSLALVQRLPRGLCSRLLVVPIGTHADSGAIDLAVADPRDQNASGEAAFFFQKPVRVHRATVTAIRAALEQIQSADATLATESPTLERSRTPIWGTPVVSVAPVDTAPHTNPTDMPIPLMRRSLTPSPPAARPASRPPRPDEDSAVLELRTPAKDGAGPDTERQVEEPVFSLSVPSSRAPLSVRRPASVMMMETRITQIKEKPAITIPAPKDPRHTMVTAPAPPRKSEPPPIVEVPRSTRVPPQITPQNPSQLFVRRAPPSSMSRAVSAPHLPLPEAGPVLAAMEEANDRDAIIALLISGMRAFARRVAIMAVKRDAFVGWSCNTEFGDARTWRTVQVPTNVPSVLATAATGTAYLGPLFRTDGHMPIIDFMKEASRDVAVEGVRVDMRPVLLLIADDLGDTALGTKRLDQLAKVAGSALARLIRKVQT